MKELKGRYEDITDGASQIPDGSVSAGNPERMYSGVPTEIRIRAPGGKAPLSRSEDRLGCNPVEQSNSERSTLKHLA
jgi:hypothetical protein